MAQFMAPGVITYIGTNDGGDNRSRDNNTTDSKTSENQ